MIWHLCLSLWNQWWCQFGVAIDNLSGDLHIVPMHGMMWRWWWNLIFFVQSRPRLRMRLVYCVHSRRWKIVLPPVWGIHGLCCGWLSLVPTNLHCSTCWSVKNLLAAQSSHLSVTSLGLSWYHSRILLRNSCLTSDMWIRVWWKYSAIVLPNLISPLISNNLLWILTWIIHIGHRKCLLCALYQWYGLISWSHHEIKGRRKLIPVCLPPHVQWYTCRCCGLVETLQWFDLLPVPPYWLGGRWCRRDPPWFSPFQIWLG